MTPASNPIIADTSGLVALVVEDDTTHEAAVAASEQVKRDGMLVVVSGEVFAETVNILGKLESNRVAIAAANFLLESPSFSVVGSDATLLAKAVAVLTRQKQSVSFVDALVMAYADHYRTRRIFGFDGAFSRNGYETPENLHVRKPERNVA